MKSPLNILIVADVIPNPDSGAAGTEVQTVRALQKLGNKVDTLWRDDLPHFVKHGNLHYLLELPFGYWHAIKKKIATNKYDVIHINQPYSWYAAMRLKRVGFAGIVVNRSHGWEPNVAKSLAPWRERFTSPNKQSIKRMLSRPMHWVLNNLYPRLAVTWSDCTLVSCSGDSDFIINNYKINADKVAVIPQAVHGDFLLKAISPMSDYRKKKVLYVGQYAFFKAPVILTQVINKLVEIDAELSFTWCCDQADHGQVNRMLSDAAKSRTNLQQWVPQEKLIELYDSHGVFAFPSFYEGFGKAFLEAMSRGCVPVCSDTGGMRDIVQHERNGMISAVGDVDSFVENILSLTKVGSDIYKMSEFSGADTKQYSWNRFASSLDQLYRGLSQPI